MTKNNSSQRNGHYQGVLLAAGKGSRMQAFSDEYPKPILPVANKPLLVHQIELLQSLGITDIIILIGHKGYQISRVLGDGSQYGVRLKYVEQEQMLGIAHALGQLESHIDRPFLMCLGDIFFVQKNVAAMFEVFESMGKGAVLATKEEPDPDAIKRNFSVIKDEKDHVIRVIEKPRHVDNNLKGVGLYLFDLNIFDAIRRTPRTAMRDEYEITDAIQVLINDGHTVRTVDAVSDDLNMTFPDDLLKINLCFVQPVEPKVVNLVAENVLIHPDARIIRSIIGNGVQINEPITISDSLIFDNVTISENVNISHAIVTPSQIVRCSIGSDLNNGKENQLNNDMYGHAINSGVHNNE